MKRKKKFVEITAAKGRPAYQRILREIERDGVCPFCPKHFKYHPKPILLDGKYWLVTENIAPYEGTKLHLLLLHKKHLEQVGEVSPAAWEELRRLLKKITRKFEIPGGSFFMRFGDKRYTHASVTQHLHAQLLVGVRRSPKTEKIKVTLGYKKK
jgi:diadenosine tetraphosphate (Ap4A) HIT family hydrolase